LEFLAPIARPLWEICSVRRKPAPLTF